MSKKWTKKEMHKLKEELMITTFVLMFFLGFFALIDFESGITGFDVGFSDNNFTAPVITTKNFALDEEIRLDGEVIGKKIMDDPSFEVYFDSISKEDGYLILNIYHDFNGSLPVWIEAVNDTLVENTTEIVENINLNETILNETTENLTESNASTEFIVSSGGENLSFIENDPMDTINTNSTANSTASLPENITSDTALNTTLNSTQNAIQNATQNSALNTVLNNITLNNSILNGSALNGSEDSKMGMNLGLDSGKNFEVCFSGENASFVCYRLFGHGSTGNEVSMLGRQVRRVRIQLQNSKVPHFKLHIGNYSEYVVNNNNSPNQSFKEIFEFYEQDLFGFGTEAVYYSQTSSGSTEFPSNNSRIHSNYINFTYVINQTDGIHNDSKVGTDLNIVGNWWLEQNTTNYADPTVNNGTISGATNTTGIVGYAYSFDGINDGISINTDDIRKTLNSSNWTMSAWAKSRSASSTQFIVGEAKATTSGNVVVWFGINGGKAWMRTINSAVSAVISTGTTSISNDIWYHFVAVYNGTTQIIYLNGILEDSDAQTGNLYQPPIQYYPNIGCGVDWGPAWDFFNGTIDEVQIWNRSLSAIEIQELYNRTMNIANRSLLLNINNAGYTTNATDYVFDSTDLKINQTFNTTFAPAQHKVWWKIATRELNDSYQSNSSEYYLELNNLVTQGTPLIGSHAYVDRNYVVGAWRFEENNGTDTLDETGLNNGTVSGARWCPDKGDSLAYNCSGRVGRGYLFDGVDDYIKTSNNALNVTKGNITISMWIKPNEIENDQGLISQYAFNLFRLDSNKLEFFVNTGVAAGYSSTFTYSANEWMNVVVTHTNAGGNNVTQFYRNGVNISSVSANTMIGEDTTRAVYFASWKAETNFFNGTIDEVMIWNRSLSATEIQELYNRTMNIANRSLLLNINNAGYTTNATNELFNAGDLKINQTFNTTFAPSQHKVWWKIATRELNDSYQSNSSEYYLELNNLVTQGTPLIGSHAYVDRNYVVGAWRFEENNGTDTKDETGINNGTLAGGVRWCPDKGDSLAYNCSGRVGRGYMFDGKDDKITASTLNNYPNEKGYLTISSWVKYTETTTNKLIVGWWWGHNNVLKTSNSKIVFSVDVPTEIKATSNNALNNGIWHHLVGTYDKDAGSGNVKLYVDGILQTSTGTGTGNLTSTDAFGIGAIPVSDGYYFNGTIDEVTVWNRSLSAEEIRQLYYSSAESYNSSYHTQDISASINTTSDADNDTIKYIYNWYVNNQSYAVLNMPFEAVNNGSEMNFSKDYSGRGNHGTTQFNSNVYQTGSGWNRTGGYDGRGAYSFDGVNDYINISNDMNMNTTSLWFKNTTRWYHVVNSSYNIYVDGQLATASSAIIPIINLSGDVIIGMTSASAYFNGTIDEVQIWNRSLSAEEIREIYNNRSYTIKSQETLKGESWKCEVTANDGYGDSTAYNTSEIVIDSVTLTVNNLAPLNNSNLSTNYVNFTYNISDSTSEAGVFNCSLWIEKSTSWQLNYTNHYPNLDGINNTINLVLEDGKYNWTMGCYDKDLEQTNSSEGVFKVTSDIITPIINLQEPINYYNSSTSSVNFTYNVTDATSDVSNCTLLLLKSGTWEYNKSYTSIAEGINNTFNLTIQDISLNWTVQCEDSAGNKANASIWNLTIDTTAPIVNLQFPTNNSNSSSAYINFTYNTTDESLNIDSCNLWLNKQGTWQLNKTDTTITETINQTFNITFQDTNLLWLVECNDTLNNKANSSMYNLTIDTSAPAVSLFYPVNDTTIACVPSINFTYNASDNPTNIQNCSLFLGYETTSANHLNSSDTTIAEDINQTFNLTMTVNNTNIYWKVGCYNDAGIQGNSSLNKFYLSTYCPPGVPVEHKGSSSGMGSAGERMASLISRIIQSVKGNVYSLDYMTPGITPLGITDPALSVYKIEIDVNTELNDVEFEIEESKFALFKRANGKVYRYVDIKKNIPDSSLNKIIIYFKVEKGFGKDIHLEHYGNEWERVPTEKINEDVQFEYYKGESSRMSLFAIVSEKEETGFSKIFRPGLVQEKITELKESGLKNVFIKALAVSVISIVFLILLFVFVRSRLKGRER